MTVVYKIIISLLMILTMYNSYALFSLKSELNNYTMILDNKVDSITVDTSGKLQTLNSKVDKLTSQKATQVVKQEIQYVQKESANDADIEFNTNPAQVSIKVNNGEKYYLNTIPNEQYKFENGKLLINQAYSTHLDITADEYKHSKWSLITAMNSDKDVIGGLNYELGHTVSATVLAGQGIKPYYGLTWRIGGHD